MKHTKKSLVLGLAAVLAWGTLTTKALAASECAATFGITGFTLNPQFIIAIVNKVKDNPDGFTSLPADSQSLNSVIQLSVNNVSGAPASLRFGVKVSDQSVGQILDTASNGDYVVTKAKLPTGVSTVSYGLVQLDGTNPVSVLPSFIDEVKNNFKDPSQLSQAIQTLGTHVFTITIQLYDDSGTALPSCGGNVSSYTTNFTLFSQPSGNTTKVPTLISPPNNASVFTTLPNFIWIPTNANTYRLEVLKDSPDGEVTRIAVPTGPASYQWRASDPALLVGHSYYWRVIGLDSTGNPIGGTNDSGWITNNMFQIVNPMGAGGVTLADVDGVVQKALIGSPDLQKLLSTMKISAVLDPASLSDDIYNQLKSGQATVTSASVSTH